MEEGFDTGLSMPIRDLIDEWESRLVIGIWLGVEVVENKPLLVNNNKNMGMLMEEILSNWNYTQSIVLDQEQIDRTGHPTQWIGCYLCLEAPSYWALHHE